MIETRELKKVFHNGDVETEVLRGINLKVENGEYIAIMGRSGAGKSTLLYQISLLDEPSGGDIFIDGRNTRVMSASERIPFRLKHFGYVFQDYALLPDLTAVENVMLPLLMQGVSKVSAHNEAQNTLHELGLTHRLNSLPSNMSGGEQQRVSIARAIVNKPKVLFADEPTANLDNESAWVIIDIFQKLHRNGQTIIMITHEAQYAKTAEKTMTIDDGRVLSVVQNKVGV